MTRLEAQYAKKYPNTYKLYQKGRLVVKPLVDNDVFQILSLPSLDYNFGAFFDECIAVLIKFNKFDEFSPKDIALMLWWIELNSFESEPKKQVIEYEKKYKQLTGNTIPTEKIAK